ncbi:MAG: hypothetical protein AB7E32_15055 [Desulfovibrio sp.]
MQRLLILIALLVQLGFGLPALAENGLRLDIAQGSGAQDAYSMDSPAGEQEENTDEGSSFLRDSLSEILGDFSVQSQMFSLIAEQGDNTLPASLLSATSSVANVFVGFKILSFEPAHNGQPATVSPWNAYMGFSYGLPGDEDAPNLSPFGTNGYNQDDGGITTHFGVNITF